MVNSESRRPAYRSSLEEELRQYPLTIIKISDFGGNDAPTARTSDASNASFTTPTPTSLEADLLHYKELFSKLRFSYVEQVTKEKTIRSMVGDPPQIVTPQENAELELENAITKARLQDIKIEVAALVTMMEKRSQELARKYERIQKQFVPLCDMPRQIDSVEREVKRMAERRAELLGEPSYLPWAKMLELQALREREDKEFSKQLAGFDARMTQRKREWERINKELIALELKKASTINAADEAKRRKENSQAEDELEAQGRWHRGVKILLSDVLNDGDE